VHTNLATNPAGVTACLGTNSRSFVSWHSGSCSRLVKNQERWEDGEATGEVGEHSLPPGQKYKYDMAVGQAQLAWEEQLINVRTSVQSLLD
jgi:hypothetical protein